MKYFKYFLIYLTIAYIAVITIGEAAVKIMNNTFVYIMYYIAEKSNFYMLRNHRCFTYADSLRLVHGLHKDL